MKSFTASELRFVDKLNWLVLACDTETSLASPTDLTSFVVMRELASRYALTGDTLSIKLVEAFKGLRGRVRVNPDTACWPGHATSAKKSNKLIGLSHGRDSAPTRA